MTVPLSGDTGIFYEEINTPRAYHIYNITAQRLKFNSPLGDIQKRIKRHRTPISPLPKWEETKEATRHYRIIGGNNDAASRKFLLRYTTQASHRAERKIENGEWRIENQKPSVTSVESVSSVVALLWLHLRGC